MLTGSRGSIEVVPSCFCNGGWLEPAFSILSSERQDSRRSDPIGRPPTTKRFMDDARPWYFSAQQQVLRLHSWLRPTINRAGAAAANTYRQLNLFGDIFERVRAHYVGRTTQSVESAINGMLSGLDPTQLYGRQELPRCRSNAESSAVSASSHDGEMAWLRSWLRSTGLRPPKPSGPISLPSRRRSRAGLTLNQAVDKMRGAVSTKIRSRSCARAWISRWM